MNISIITLAAKATDSANLTQLASALKTVSIVMFALAAFCLILSVVAFIIFKIPVVIGDLSGRNARKSIAKMRDANEKSGNKSHRPHPVAVSRGPLTEQVKDNKNKTAKQNKTAKANTPNNNQFNGSSPTDVLNTADENATENLSYNDGGTEVLSEGTEILSNEQIQSAVNSKPVKFNMIKNIVLIHTEEVI